MNERTTATILLLDVHVHLMSIHFHFHFHYLPYQPKYNTNTNTCGDAEWVQFIPSSYNKQYFPLNFNDIPGALHRLMFVSSTLMSHKHIADNNGSRFPWCGWYAMRALGIILKRNHFLARLGRMRWLNWNHNGAARMCMRYIGRWTALRLHRYGNITHTRQIKFADAARHKIFHVTF